MLICHPPPSFVQIAPPSLQVCANLDTLLSDPLDSYIHFIQLLKTMIHFPESWQFSVNPQFSTCLYTIACQIWTNTVGLTNYTLKEQSFGITGGIEFNTTDERRI